MPTSRQPAWRVLRPGLRGEAPTYGRRRSIRPRRRAARRRGPNFPVCAAGGQRRADRIARSISQSGLHDAGCAGADEHPDAAAAPSCRRRLHGVEKSVLLHAKFSQTVVAAVEYLQVLGQWLRIDAGDFADVGIDFHGLELAALKSAALLD